jgi:hypothetical protein
VLAALGLIKDVGISMDIKCIAGFAAITKQPDASALLYQEALGLPLEKQDDYRFMDKFPGANHFGVWPLKNGCAVLLWAG